ncbi:MAG: cysteine desulfurase [Actinomycetaceae bacterium]|nr:cysteine desulfurase [Actinomycetaceae bacterium]
MSCAPRADFPILSREVRDGVPLVYLDSAATSQKPQVVMDAVMHQELYSNGAVNRGSHQLAAESTIAVDNAREKVARFVGVKPDEIVWTKNSTEGLNLLANVISRISAGEGSAKIRERLGLGPGDNVVITRAEHHANLVPWQDLCRRTGAELRWLDVDSEGRIDLTTADVIDSRTRIVSFTHVSNVTGALSPVAQIVDLARAVDAFIVLDACQSVPHIPVDFKALNVDAAVFSGHKMLGPTGIGVLYVRSDVLRELPPFLTGGSMVVLVTMEKTTFAPPPARFEAGTQPVAQIVGLGAAADYLTDIGMDKVAQHEAELTAYALEKLSDVPGVRILGPRDAAERVGVLAFDVEGVHPHDVGQVLDARGIAIRVGHHCAQPIHQHFGVFASSRASFGPYNTTGDVDAFIEALAQVRPFFGLAG